MMMQPIAPAEMTEFWRWLANGSLAVTVFFLLQLVKVQRSHGVRLNNHAQRLSKLDNDVEPSAGE